MTVTCETCGVAPKLPEWMAGWFTVFGKSWCPAHRHSVRVVLDETHSAMDAVERARAAWEASQPQLFLEL